jgi:ADP-ribose pyrophosphatase
MLMKPWKTLSRRIISQHGKYLRLESHTVELPDGRIIPEWPWLITPEYVNIIAIDNAGMFLCFQQTKYSVEGLTYAPVGGYIESDETPLEAARRELREETGYEAQDWIHLGSYTVDGNRGAGKAHLFLARRAEKVTSPIADDLEDQHLMYLTRSELEAALVTGEFKILPWATVAALALLYMR